MKKEKRNPSFSLQQKKKRHLLNNLMNLFLRNSLTNSKKKKKLREKNILSLDYDEKFFIMKEFNPHPIL